MAAYRADTFHRVFWKGCHTSSLRRKRVLALGQKFDQPLFNVLLWHVDSACLNLMLEDGGVLIMNRESSEWQ